MQQYSRTLSKRGVLYGARLAGSVLGALSTLIASHGLRTAEFVELYTVIVLLTLYLYGIDIVNSQFILSKKSDITAPKTLVEKAIKIRLIVSLFILIILICINLLNIYQSMSVKTSLIPIAVFSFIAPFFVLNVNLYIENKLNVLTKNILIQSLVQLILVSVCYLLELSAPFYLISYVASYFVQINHLMKSLNLRFFNYLLKVIQVQTTWIESRRILVGSFWLFGSSLAILLLYKGSIFLAVPQIGDDLAKTALISIKLLDALFLLPATFVPQVIVKYSNRQMSQIMLYKLIGITLFGSLFIYGLFWLFAGAFFRLMNLMVTPEASSLALLLVLCFVPYSLDSLCGSYLVSQGKYRFLFWSGLSITVIAFGFIGLISLFGDLTPLDLGTIILLCQSIRTLSLVFIVKSSI